MPEKVVKSKQNPETTEILAEAIARIGDAVTKLNASGLNRRAIEVLIYHETKISMRDIRSILDALPRLQGWYCRKG